MPPFDHQKLWIDTHGKLHPVPDSHEEWANRHGRELEALLDAGWVRVQNVPPSYLLIDVQLPPSAVQAKPLAGLFENRFHLIVVEFRGDSKSFVDEEQAKAWVIGRQ